MKKRYAITMDDQAMQLIRIEAVKAGVTVGEWISGWLDDGKQVTVIGPTTFTEEIVMDEPVKKAIEQDQVKADRGRLNKGLGEIPGVTKGPGPGFGSPRPAPKPKK